jgi:hypothetical protein
VSKDKLFVHPKCSAVDDVAGMAAGYERDVAARGVPRAGLGPGRVRELEAAGKLDGGFRQFGRGEAGAVLERHRHARHQAAVDGHLEQPGIARRRKVIRDGAAHDRHHEGEIRRTVGPNPGAVRLVEPDDLVEVRGGDGGGDALGYGRGRRRAVALVAEAVERVGRVGELAQAVQGHLEPTPGAAIAVGRAVLMCGDEPVREPRLYRREGAFRTCHPSGGPVVVEQPVAHGEPGQFDGEADRQRAGGPAPADRGSVARVDPFDQGEGVHGPGAPDRPEAVGQRFGEQVDVGAVDVEVPAVLDRVVEVALRMSRQQRAGAVDELVEHGHIDRQAERLTAGFAARQHGRVVRGQPGGVQVREVVAGVAGFRDLGPLLGGERCEQGIAFEPSVAGDRLRDPIRGEGLGTSAVGLAQHRTQRFFDRHARDGVDPAFGQQPEREGQIRARIRPDLVPREDPWHRQAGQMCLVELLQAGQHEPAYAIGEHGTAPSLFEKRTVPSFVLNGPRARET